MQVIEMTRVKKFRIFAILFLVSSDSYLFLISLCIMEKNPERSRKIQNPNPYRWLKEPKPSSLQVVERRGSSAIGLRDAFCRSG